MAHAILESPEAPVVLEARQTALQRVVVAASMLEEDEARALMSMPAEELGQSLQSGLSQTVPMARRIRLDLQKKYAESKGGIQTLISEGLAKRKSDADSAAWDSVVDPDKVLKVRQALVRAKKLLPAAAIWAGLGVTKQALSKAVASGRIFTVDVGPTTFYPAFYLDSSFDRKQLAKVTQTLGSLPGWSKWQFFTTQSDYLDGVTPLEALSRGMVDEVKKLALAFIER